MKKGRPVFNVMLIKKGRIVHYKGMPFKLEHDILVYGNRWNMNLANEVYDETRDEVIKKLNEGR